MLKALVAAIRRVATSRDAASAVEFALVCPLLVVLLGAAVELSGAITASNRATFVAETVAQVVSQAKRPITTDEMAGYIKSAALVDPDIVAYAKATGKALDQAVNIAVSSIKFSLAQPACQINCQYVADVVFSEALAGSKRSCGKVAEGGGQSMATLPSALFTTSPLVVVDVEVFYRPLMTTILGSEISFKRQVYFRPRNVAVVNYAKNCPGFAST